MTPFILQKRIRLADDQEPDPSHLYDDVRQIWIDLPSGDPIISGLQQNKSSSQFGETTMTRTAEGADQTEASRINASPFGETSMTKTHEGTDQTEISALSASPFGETLLTATVEGADQSEIVGQDSYPAIPSHF